MLLQEFFGKSLETKSSLDKDKKDNMSGDDLFWFIIDHDKLHKDYFHPIAKKIIKQTKLNKLNKEELMKEFFPMAKKGCMEYFTKNKMKGNPEKIFTKEVYKDLCEKLYDHYKEDVIKGEYKLG